MYLIVGAIKPFVVAFCVKIMRTSLERRDTAQGLDPRSRKRSGRGTRLPVDACMFTYAH